MITFYGFEKRIKQTKWYTGFCGIKLFSKRFIGFSIHHDRVVVKLKPNIIAKPSIGIWFYIFFYNIHVQFKDPWKNVR
jgi:hypothetical protein